MTHTTSSVFDSRRMVESGPRHIDWHTHRRHELLWGFSGLRTAETAGVSWTLPPNAGLWIPAGTPHAGFAGASASHHFTFVNAEAVTSPWPLPTLVSMPPALREILLHLQDTPAGRPERPHLETAAMAMLRPLVGSEIPLPTPTEPRARAVAVAITANPSDPRTAAQWSHTLGISGRTLDRVFSAETGMTFAQWRAQARIRAAVALLTDGHTSTATAQRVGYQTPSAFVRAFRQATGATPQGYVRALAASEDTPGPTACRQ